jgi:hypothetical protein
VRYRRWPWRTSVMPLALFTVLDVTTYAHCFVPWHDVPTDGSVVISCGKVIISERRVPVSKAPASTVTEAKLFATGKTVWLPPPVPFRKSRGVRVIPLFPFVAVSGVVGNKIISAPVLVEAHHSSCAVPLPSNQHEWILAGASWRTGVGEGYVLLRRDRLCDRCLGTYPNTRVVGGMPPGKHQGSSADTF